MAKRGRKSTAALTTTVVPLGKLPPPPPRLSDYEASLWDAIVATKPADYFQADTLPLLEAYCCHVATYQMIDALVRKFDPETLAREESAAKLFDKFSRLRENESKATLALARSLRLTQQARYTPRTAARQNAKVSGGRPWEPAM